MVPIIILIFGFLITHEQFLFVSKKNPPIKGYRLYFIVWLAFALTTLFYTKSFGGWFGLIGGIGFLFLFIPRFSGTKLCVFLGFFTVVIAGFFYLSNRTPLAHVDRFWQVSSFQTRKEIWTNSLALITEHPILGIGLADFSRDYRAYIQTLPISKQPVEREVLRPHNLFLDLWLETGISGLIAFLWIIIIFYHRALRRHSGMNTVSVYTGAALFSLILHGLVDTPYFKNDLALLFWFIIAISSLSTTPQLDIPAH